MSSNSRYLRDIEEKWEFEPVPIERVEPTKLSDLIHEVQVLLREEREHHLQFEEMIQKRLNMIQRRIIEVENGYRPF